MIDLHNKDWVNHMIIAGGIIFGVLIIIGFVSSVRSFIYSPLAPSSGIYLSTSTPDESSLPAVAPSPTTSGTCTNCFGIDQNNSRVTITYPTQITVELPEALYSENNLVIVTNPTGVFEKIGAQKSKVKGNWIETFQTVKKGFAEVIVKSNAVDQSDYQVSLTVQ